MRYLLPVFLLSSLNVNKAFCFIFDRDSTFVDRPYPSTASAFLYAPPTKVVKREVRRSLMNKSDVQKFSTQNIDHLDDQVEFRAYDEKWHKEAVVNICKHVYDGRDYLPRMIDRFSASSLDFPMVLCRKTHEVLAVGNLQIMTPEHSWIQVLMSFEASNQFIQFSASR
jgi:hypothetical protein